MQVKQRKNHISDRTERWNKGSINLSILVEVERSFWPGQGILLGFDNPESPKGSV